MKKLLLLLLVAVGAYKYTHHSWPFKPARALTGAATVVLVGGPNCAQACEQIRDLLKERAVAFDEISVAGENGEPVANQYGITGYPTTLIGQNEVRGNDLPRIKAALAEAYGKSALTRRERMVMDAHFDEAGHPKVVLYGTTWCGYCKAEREFLSAHDIPFDDIDVEGSDAAALSYATLEGQGYPLTYIGYRRIAGADNDAILAAYDVLSKTRQVNVR
jgi:glutaredoxin